MGDLSIYLPNMGDQYRRLFQNPRRATVKQEEREIEEEKKGLYYWEGWVERKREAKDLSMGQLSSVSSLGGGIQKISPNFPQIIGKKLQGCGDQYRGRGGDSNNSLLSMIPKEGPLRLLFMGKMEKEKKKKKNFWRLDVELPCFEGGKKRH